MKTLVSSEASWWTRQIRASSKKSLKATTVKRRFFEPHPELQVSLFGGCPRVTQKDIGPTKEIAEHSKPPKTVLSSQK